MTELTPLDQEESKILFVTQNPPGGALAQTHPLKRTTLFMSMGLCASRPCPGPSGPKLVVAASGSQAWPIPDASRAPVATRCRGCTSRGGQGSVPWTCFTQERAYCRVARVPDFPLLRFSEGSRIFISFSAFISSFWVFTRADCSLLQLHKRFGEKDHCNNRSQPLEKSAQVI